MYIETNDTVVWRTAVIL